MGGAQFQIIQIEFFVSIGIYASDAQIIITLAICCKGGDDGAHAILVITHGCGVGKMEI